MTKSTWNLWAESEAVPMQRALPDRLEDILTNITHVSEYTKGKDFAAFQEDKLLRAAVERCIERISEASQAPAR